VSCPPGSTVRRRRRHLGAPDGRGIPFLASRLGHLEAEEMLDLAGEADGEQGHDRQQRHDDEPEPHSGPARSPAALDPRTAARTMEAVRALNGVGIDRRRLGGRMVFQLLCHQASVRP
jgi:hypothetical protein